MVDLAIGQQVRIKTVDEICDEFSIPHPDPGTSMTVNECTIVSRAWAYCGGTYAVGDIDYIDDMVYISETDWWWPVEVIDADMSGPIPEIDAEAWFRVVFC